MRRGTTSYNDAAGCKPVIWLIRLFKTILYSSLRRIEYQGSTPRSSTKTPFASSKRRFLFVANTFANAGDPNRPIGMTKHHYFVNGKRVAQLPKPEPPAGVHELRWLLPAAVASVRASSL